MYDKFFVPVTGGYIYLKETVRRGDVFSKIFSSDSDKCLHFWYYVRRVTAGKTDRVLRLYVNREGIRGRALLFRTVSSRNQWLHRQITLKEHDRNMPFKVGIFE